jgi:ribose 5-phosphate isomerase A
MSDTNRTDAEEEKRTAGVRAAAFVEDGMAVGLGTGSTAVHVVKALGARVRAGLRIVGLPTSEATRKLAEAEGIPLKTVDDVERLDVAIDGADEIDRDLHLTKGGGGAHLREKVIAAMADRFVVVADSSKLVSKLGRFPTPVEVVPFALAFVRRAIEKLGGAPDLRMKDGAPFRTDNGLLVLDCRFGSIDDPPRLAAALDAIPGVAEHGLFCGMTSLAIVGRRFGVEIVPAR